MKKICIYFSIVFLLTMNSAVQAHHCYSHYHVTYKDYYEEEINFPDCERHYLINGVHTYYYSNGGRSRYIIGTIFNSDGSVLQTDCKKVRHYIQNGKHYFSFYRDKRYQIMAENGRIITTKPYKQMDEISKGKLLVKLNKKYGVIDLNGNEIIPIKYKTFKNIGNDLYLTKLNGYWGVINSSNKIIVKNENDKISKIHDCFLIKKQGKFGLMNSDGKIICKTECEKIKKLGEYILVKFGKNYSVFDSNGNLLSKKIYKDIRLERNTLEGKVGKVWEEIPTE